ncbi:hypothetical protein ACIBI9_31385 [Nonomuraea sp. NPDC050451]|uniref:hypothetical protein n=1 Tax=Nonomuraea sp. NPDC050451 TaxID=3364364 RepID=UPI00378DC4C1
MAREKDVWIAKPGASIGGYGLKNNGTAREYVVKIALVLERDPSRMVVLELTPDQAETIGQNFIESAEKARARNGQ